VPTFDEDITREFWGDASPRRSHSGRPAPRHRPRRRLTERFDPNFSRNLLVVGLALFAFGGLSAFALGSDEESEPAPEALVVTAVETTETTAEMTAAEVTGPETTVPETTVPETTRSAAESCALRYEVRAGDFWIRIADGAGVSLSDVLAANSATTESVLLPGDRVCLPAGASMPSPPTTTVAPTTTAAPTAAPTTTPAPTTTAAPRPTGSNESSDQVQAIIREVFPEDQHEMALRVARRESNYRPGVYNGHCCYGVFQIHWQAHRSWLANHGVTEPSHLLDARTNIRMAWVLYQRSGGWRPWSQTAY